MDNLNISPRRNGGSWRVYLLLVGLIIGTLVVIQIYSTASRGNTAKKDPWQALMTGDMQTKIALSDLPGVDTRMYARDAIKLYEDAEPYSAAYRRIGVIKTGILKQKTAIEFDKIDSPAAIKAVGQKRASGLSHEAEMWRSIFKQGGISKSEAKVYVARVTKLNIGPLNQIAVALVYERSHQPQKAAEARKLAEFTARYDVVAAGSIIGLLILAGIIGVGLAIRFFAIYGSELSWSPRPRIQSSVLFIAFIVYLVSFLLLELIMALIENVASYGGLNVGSAIGLLMEAVAILGASGLGLAALKIMTAYSGEDMMEIGYRNISVKRDVKWGIGGFCAALPFWAIALIITIILSLTIFKNIKTPEQPFGPLIASGGGLVVALIFILGMVIAPLVEETFFRGVLYTALRGKMQVWPAVLLSAGIFAIIHPLPGGFLPIFTLAVVFALLREKTGSLLPSMVCHSIYNGILLLITLLLY